MKRDVKNLNILRKCPEMNEQQSSSFAKHAGVLKFAAHSKIFNGI